MDKLQLVIDTFKRLNTEKMLFSYWKHFPYHDLVPDKLAEAHISYYNRHNFDLLKISFHGRYPCIDFGAKLSEDYDPISGSTRCDPIIEQVSDWESLEPVDINEGEFGKQLRAVELISRQLESLPKMSTIFSPLMIASKLDPNIEQHIKTDPGIIIEVLYILDKVTTEFARASLDAGAEGIFLASQHLRKTDLAWTEVERFELFFLNKMLNVFERKADFSVLHIHGEEIFFDKVAERIVVDALNWHDQTTWPSIKEAAEISNSGFLAGIDENGLLEKTPLEIKEGITKTLSVAQEVNRVIIAPGCVIPVDVKDENLDIISAVINRYNKQN